MKKLIVVTGAAGFIGRNLVAELNARGHDHLLLVDQLGTDDKWKNLIGLRYENLIHPDTYLKALPPASAVIHLGACSATTEKDADYLLRNNYGYTRTLAEHCMMSNTRFIYASSAGTYGDGGLGYSDDDAVTPSLQPITMYGYSKHMFDLWALKHGLFSKIVGLKYFNVFGPYEDHKGEMRSVVQRSYHQIKDTGEVKLFKSYRKDFKDGEQQRDFIYVKDVVDVTLWFLDNAKGGLFNVGTGQARTWKDLAKAVFTAMKLKPKITFIDMPPHMQGKYQYFTRADMDKLRRAGYTKPFTSLEDAVHDYVTTYLVKQ